MTHACYLLRSLNPRFKRSFYIGCTTDPRRRLRQHNGEVGQGANFTKAKRPWEMVLCVYGFSSHVNALQFEWAWQHPLVSLAVKEAAAKLPSLKGVPGMITLVCTMVTLPKWNSLNLTVQFMLSSLLQHRQGSPPLPPQMRLFVAPIHSLPGKDSEDDNDDIDDLSTCPDDLSQNVQLDEDSYVNASSCPVGGRAGVVEVSSAAELYTSHETTSSPCPKANGKKSRKGKTPQERKGKRGGTRKPSEDPILIELQLKGSGSRTFFEVEEISSAERKELNDCSSVLDSSRVMLTAVETMCTSSGSQRERIDCHLNPVDLSDSSSGERIPSYLDSKADSLGSIEIDLDVFAITGIKATTNETAQNGSEGRKTGSDGFSKLDLIYGSIGERLSLHETSTVQSCWFENRVSATTSKSIETDSISHSSQGQKIDSYTVSEDLSSWSIEENVILKDSRADHHSKRPTVNDGDSLCASRVTGAVTHVDCVGYGHGEKISTVAVSEEDNVARSHAERGESNYDYGVFEDISDRSIGERAPSDGISEDQSQKYFMRSSLEREGGSGAKTATQEFDSGDSDIEEISVEEFQTAEGRRKGSAVHSTQSTEGDTRNMPPPASDGDVVQMSVREKNLFEDESVKGVGLHQKSLKTFFPVRKQGTVPTSIYRKARNGEICKVLEDNSNTRNAPIEEVSKEKCSGSQQAFLSSNGERVQDATLIIDSDDDEIQEISVVEFKQSAVIGKLGVTGKKEKVVCSLNNFR